MYVVQDSDIMCMATLSLSVLTNDFMLAHAVAIICS